VVKMGQLVVVYRAALIRLYAVVMTDMNASATTARVFVKQRLDSYDYYRVTRYSYFW